MNLLCVCACACFSIAKSVFERHQKHRRDYDEGKRIATADEYTFSMSPSLASYIIHNRFLYDQYNYNYHKDRVPSRQFIRGYNDVAKELGITPYKQVGPVGKMLLMGGYGMSKLENNDVFENSDLRVSIPNEDNMRFFDVCSEEHYEYDCLKDGTELFTVPEKGVEFRIGPDQVAYKKL
jgi:hypothetical protein